MDIGFIRFGHMGAPMTRNLLKAGRLQSHAQQDLNTDARGHAIAERVAGACQDEILITMLADDAAVEGVVFADCGALSALRRDAIHISMSTIGVGLRSLGGGAWQGRPR